MRKRNIDMEADLLERKSAEQPHPQHEFPQARVTCPPYPPLMPAVPPNINNGIPNQPPGPLISSGPPPGPPHGHPVAPPAKPQVDIRQLIYESLDPVLGESNGPKTLLDQLLIQMILSGIHYVEELLPEFNPGGMFEAKYVCTLCVVNSPALNMFNHLIGHGHKKKYLEMRHGIFGLDKASAMQAARQLEEQEGRRIDLMKSTYCKETRAIAYMELLVNFSFPTIGDATYPWPAGKAPWSKEQGGSGVAPSGSGNSLFSKANR